MTIQISTVTTAEVSGNGIFDVLMRSVKAHLGEEFSAGRIRGTEYASVYLGALQSTLNAAIEFALQKDKLDAEILLVGAQTEKVNAEKLLVDQQKLKEIEATSLLTQQKLNAITEETVLAAQKCKLDAEFDVLVETKLKTTAETGLLNQRKLTEQAQITGTGVDADSVIGRQKALYVAQTNGFSRDAEQKAARILVDTWNVRRTTDEGTSANSTNKLDDSNLGLMIAKLLEGAGVSLV